MKRKIIDLDAEIMAWAEEHDIQLNEEIKFWKIKTSYISILNKFLYFGADEFDWTDIKFRIIKGNINETKINVRT
jgi:hypothetical protein